MVNVNDPVAQGVVASLAHPGGNITGITLDDSPEIAAKRMQFLKDAIPHAAKVAVLTDSRRYNGSRWPSQSLKLYRAAISYHH
jgi:putative ABC transport system substrate-binding protein